MTADDVAAHLSIKRESVYRMTARGDGFPQPQHVGRTPLWAADEIREWRAAHPTRKVKGSDSPPA